MYIDPKTTLFGLPGKQVRDFVRAMRYNYDHITVRDAEKFFKITSPSANLFLNELVFSGFCAENENVGQHYPRSIRVIDGVLRGRIAAASCAKPVSRKVATKHLDALMERVKVVNESVDYFFYVPKVAIFGSYFEGKDVVSDVDIAIEVEKRPEYADLNYSDYEKLAHAKASNVDRYWSDYDEMVDWPKREVWLYLKNKSRVIGFCRYSTYKSLNTGGKDIYEFRFPGAIDGLELI